MKSSLVVLILLLFAAPSVADELFVLETYHPDNWVSFSNHAEPSCFVDSSGALYVSYRLLRDSQWVQFMLKSYRDGEPARGGALTGWGPGSWWGPRVCKISGNRVEVMLSQMTDYYPMPIGHKLMTMNHSENVPLREQFTRIVTDTEFSHLWSTSDSTAAGFCADFGDWDAEVVRFLSNVRLYDTQQYDSLPLEMEADTLWESPEGYYGIQAAKIPADRTYSVLINAYSDTFCSFVCLRDDQVIVEIDSLYPTSLTNLAIRALNDVFLFTWIDGGEMFYQTFNPIDTSFGGRQLFFNADPASLNSRIHTRLQFDESYIYRQTPVLIDFSSADPPNWSAIIRQVISRNDFSVISIDTALIFGSPPVSARHSFTVSNGEMHSVITVNEGAASRLYYYGPLDVVSTSEERETPVSFKLSNPFPNPFNGSVLLEISVPEQMDLEVSIFDIGGRQVHAQSQSKVSPGIHELMWSGIDNSGQPLTSGMYIVQIDGAGYSASKKVVMLK